MQNKTGIEQEQERVIILFGIFVCRGLNVKYKNNMQKSEFIKKSSRKNFQIKKN